MRMDNNLTEFDKMRGYILCFQKQMVKISVLLKQKKSFWYFIFFILRTQAQAINPTLQGDQKTK